MIIWSLCFIDFFCTLKSNLSLHDNVPLKLIKMVKSLVMCDNLQNVLCSVYFVLFYCLLLNDPGSVPEHIFRQSFCVSQD